MNTDLSPTTPTPLARRLSPSPGMVVAVVGILLLAVIIAGVLLTSGGNNVESADTVTIAELRSDPDRFDNQSVTLSGASESVRELPYLSQYALYTLRDATGTLLVLTQSGAPPGSGGEHYSVTGRYHSKVTLDDELKRLVQEKLGTVAGNLVGALLPGVPLHVVFLEHQRYEPISR